jgi:hypothetical protein
MEKHSKVTRQGTPAPAETIGIDLGDKISAGGPEALVDPDTGELTRPRKGLVEKDGVVADVIAGEQARSRPGLVIGHYAKNVSPNFSRIFGRNEPAAVEKSTRSVTGVASAPGKSLRSSR